ncbi:DNA N-6-adenine-methyltransferase [Tenacibaculum caenipelagi]|uniref:Phage N-6-adenine-methyltransferase n=1 Tax=Tenacibaculum caenipelagi TaxID=1325435 RepID=A0A4R6TG19_9FLAO|nr:DNA N-6-adenine-methyltransferase [Tenacibaculum caenipelagi]TDQ27666.1 phage N-6-adenine-methyltransferase [Tenacibaculum caenipelagi]
MSHEAQGKSNEWYTAKFIFDALDVKFDLDVASPEDRSFCNVPATRFFTNKNDGLNTGWIGFVWMNPPFGDRKTKTAWINKFIHHGNGIALFPDRTSASWWQLIADNSDAHLFTKSRISFIKPSGELGNQPANGTTLFAIGSKAIQALKNAEKNGLGKMYCSLKV